MHFWLDLFLGTLFFAVFGFNLNVIFFLLKAVTIALGNNQSPHFKSVYYIMIRCIQVCPLVDFKLYGCHTCRIFNKRQMVWRNDWMIVFQLLLLHIIKKSFVVHFSLLLPNLLNEVGEKLRLSGPVMGYGFFCLSLWTWLAELKSGNVGVSSTTLRMYCYNLMQASSSVALIVTAVLVDSLWWLILSWNENV